MIDIFSYTLGKKRGGGSGEIEAGIVFTEITDKAKVIRAKVYGSGLPLYAFAGQDELIEVEMPNNLDTIRSNTFYGCRVLPHVAISDSVASVETSAFYECRALELAALPAALTSIGSSAFYRCMKFTITEIPAGVTEIKGNAFSYCTGITSLTFKGTPVSIASTSFSNCSALKVLNVPWAEGTVENAPWGATNATINYNYTGE